MDQNDTTSASRFRPRFSLLTVLLVMALVACGITIWQLWQEVGPLRAENKRFNEERGTLVIGDPNQLHALKIPDRFAGEGRESFRVYVPPGQSYVAFLWVNSIPKAGFPEHRKPSDFAGILGGGHGRLFGELRPGEHIVTVNTVRHGGKADIALDVDSLDVSANTTKDQWPTAKPENYTVFGGGVDRTTVAADGAEPLVLLRQRIMGVARETVHVSYVTPIREPDLPLDGVLLWVERAK